VEKNTLAIIEQMAKSRIIIALGAVIALLPLLGFPHSAESFFQVVTGLAIVGVSVWTRIDKKLTLKAKARARQARREDFVATEAEAEATSEDLQLRRATDFYPKTGQRGRRVSDLKLTPPPVIEEREVQAEEDNI
jgi:hypothetical protein